MQERNRIKLVMYMNVLMSASQRGRGNLCINLAETKMEVKMGTWIKFDKIVDRSAIASCPHHVAATARICSAVPRPRISIVDHCKSLDSSWDVF